MAAKSGSSWTQNALVFGAGLLVGFLVAQAVHGESGAAAVVAHEDRRRKAEGEMHSILSDLRARAVEWAERDFYERN